MCCPVCHPPATAGTACPTCPIVVNGFLHGTYVPATCAARCLSWVDELATSASHEFCWCAALLWVQCFGSHTAIALEADYRLLCWHLQQPYCEGATLVRLAVQSAI